MSQSILSNHAGALRPPTVGALTILGAVALWLALGCALPLYQVREARRQAHQDLLHALTADNKLDAGSVVAAFDRSNQHLDAAASGPCLILAVTSILLINRMLRLRRHCHALTHALSSSGGRAAGSNRAPEE